MITALTLAGSVFQSFNRILIREGSSCVVCLLRSDGEVFGFAQRKRRCILENAEPAALV